MYYILTWALSLDEKYNQSNFKDLVDDSRSKKSNKVTLFYFTVHWPKHVDFDKPENEGLSGARNFYISTDLKVEVGVWHILPQDLIEESQKHDERKKEWFENSLSHGQPIILYLHGNTGSRAREHRIELYKVLQKLNYHVICFDYRGIFKIEFSLL